MQLELIGLGRMGASTARRLFRRGDVRVVYVVDQARGDASDIIIDRATSHCL